MHQIDPEWLQRELHRVRTTLTAQYPALAPNAIEEAVHDAAGELAGTVQIVTSLPMLIHRRAQARLQAVHCGQLTPVRPPPPSASA